MSGHSKWSTIKRAKGASDAKRAVLFAKLSKKISIATREGGSGDPAHNFKLRVEIEKARNQSMPNDNIERAIKKGLGQNGGSVIEEVVYEAYGPFGVALIIEAATDNKNRTVQSIKSLLTKNGGALGEQGSTAWQFETIAQIMIAGSGQNMPEIELKAIEMGATDIEESSEGLIIYAKPENLHQISEGLKSESNVVSAEIIRRCLQPVELSGEQQNTIYSLIEKLEDDEDVVAVFTSIK